MATENQKISPEENTAGTPSDNELFADQPPVLSEVSERELFAADEDFYASLADSDKPTVSQKPVAVDQPPAEPQLSAQELFAGDEDFYASLVDSDKPTMSQRPVAVDQPPAEPQLSAQEIFPRDEDSFTPLVDSDKPTMSQRPVAVDQPQITPVPHKRFSRLEKALVAGIILIAAIVIYTLLESPPVPPTSQTPAPPAQITSPDQQTPAPEPLTAQSPSVAPLQPEEAQPLLDSTQPLSLKIAQNLHREQDLDKAYVAYDQLRQSLQTSTQEELLSDFLQLKMALCSEKKGDYDQAGRSLRELSRSSSPAVRVVANYHRSLLEMQRGQYLNARTRAYQAIAIMDAVDFDKDCIASLKRDCYFLTAEAVTRKVLSLRDADRDLPEDLWSNIRTPVDPFANVDESQLLSLLNSGSKQLSRALLAPQIQASAPRASSPRYAVISHRTPMEELLTKFAANAGLDVHWALDPRQIGIRKRAVYLYLPAATTQQFVTLASGCAGLLATLDERSVVNIFNPADCPYVSEQISLLSDEAVSLWQRFLLSFHDDRRLANAHFALGLLQVQKGRVNESTGEYKLVANRFPRSPLAPVALLNSSKLKAGLRDYTGAAQDLTQLVEQYPDAAITGRAYLDLANMTAQAQLYAKAQRLYRKVYNLSLSVESQSAAALGVGKCSYQMKDYESAAKWLTRYISLARDPKDKDLYSAHFLLGKTNLALGKSKAACAAFENALAGQEQLSAEKCVEAISALVEGYVEQNDFITALNILEDIYLHQLSPEESIDILLLKCRIFRAMGLVDKTIAALGDRAEHVSDLQLKAKISFELANCYAAKGDLQQARKEFAEILIFLEPGTLAYETALKLADVCLKLNQKSQAVSVCLQLLDLNPPEQTKQGALDLLATAYDQQKDYDRAALALLGQWK